MKNLPLPPSSHSAPWRFVHTALATLAVGLLCAAAPAHAADDVTWTGPDGGDWGTSANWTYDDEGSPANMRPLTGDIAIFSTAGVSTVTNNNAVDQKPASILFDDAVGSITIGTVGGHELQLQNGGTVSILGTLAGTGKTITINAPLVLVPAGATSPLAYTFANNSADASNTLNIGGDITGGTTSAAGILTLTGDNTGANTISGIISNGDIAGGLGLTKTGAGTWILAGANTYTGLTTVSTGILNIQNSTAFATHSEIEVAAGAILQLEGGIAGGDKRVKLSANVDSGVLPFGLQNISGNNSYAGTVWVASNGGISSESGTLTLANVFAGSTWGAAPGTKLYLAGAGDGVISGSLGSNGLIKRGAGTWTISGAATNTYVTVDAGTLVISASGGLSSGNSNVNTGGFLTTTVANAITGNANLSLNGGTTTLGAANNTIGTVTLNKATLIVGHNNALGNGLFSIANQNGILQASTSGINLSTSVQLNGNFSIEGAYGIGFSGTVTQAVNTVISSTTGANHTFSGPIYLSNAAAVSHTLLLMGNYNLAGLISDFNGASTASSGLNLGYGHNAAVISNISFAGSPVNTYSGTTTFTKANIDIAGNAKAFGNSVLNFQGNSDPTATKGLYSSTGPVTIENEVIFGGNTAFVFGGTNQLTFTKDFMAASGQRASAMYNNNTGGVVFSGTFYISGETNNAEGSITITGSGNTIFAAGIANKTPAGVAGGGTGPSTVTISNTGGGIVTFAGENTYTSRTTINAGAIVNYQNSIAFGANSAITANAGATIQVSGNIVGGMKEGSVVSNTLTINGTGATGQTGVLVNVSGTNGYAGYIYLPTASTISSDAGLLNLTGTINLNGKNLTLAGAGDGHISSPLTVMHTTLVKNGAGTWLLSGSNDMSSAGSLIVNEGTLQAATKLSVLPRPETWNTTRFSVKSGATLAFNVGGVGEYTATDIAALAKLGDGTGGFQNGSRIGLDTSNATSGTFTYAASGTNANSQGLIKMGANTLELTGTTGFNGGTLVEEGTLDIAAGATLTSDVTLAEATTLKLKGTLLGNLIAGEGSTVDFGLSAGDVRDITLQSYTAAASSHLDMRINSNTDLDTLTTTLTGGLTLGGDLRLTVDASWDAEALAEGAILRLLLTSSDTDSVNGWFEQGVVITDQNGLNTYSGAEGTQVLINGATFQLSYNVDGKNNVGFIVAPVPEPGTWALLTGGLATLALLRRRRK